MTSEEFIKYCESRGPSMSKIARVESAWLSRFGSGQFEKIKELVTVLEKLNN